MKNNLNLLQGITLLAAVGTLCLWSGTAFCQRAGRQTGQAGQTMAACQNGSSSQAGSAATTTGGASVSGTASSNYTAYLAARYNQALAQRSTQGATTSTQQTSGAVLAQRMT